MKKDHLDPLSGAVECRKCRSPIAIATPELNLGESMDVVIGAECECGALQALRCQFTMITDIPPDAKL